MFPKVAHHERLRLLVGCPQVQKSMLSRSARHRIHGMDGRVHGCMVCERQETTGLHLLGECAKVEHGAEREERYDAPQGLGPIKQAAISFARVRGGLRRADYHKLGIRN